MTKIGFAGLGRMGIHMARNLVAAGHDVTVWNRSTDKARAFAAETGCAVAESPAALTAATEVVFTMLSDDPSSETVHLGEDGLFSGAGATVFVEMGTMSPDHIAALVQAAPDGVTVIDAPVSGATKPAEDGQLLIMAGCESAVAAPLMPFFDAMGRQTICLGQSGAGAVMKLAVNSLVHGINQTLAEAMALAEASGIAREDAFGVIESSAAAAPSLKVRRALYLDESSGPVTFTIALARKDMELTAALADRLGTAMPQGKVTLEKLKEAEGAGYAGRDLAAMLSYMREDET